MSWRRALVAAASLLVWPAAAPCAAQSSAQQSGTLPGGAAYVMQQDSGAPTAALELWYRAPSAGYDLAHPGLARLALAAAAAAKPPRGASLSELVNRAGGVLSLQVFPDIAMVGVSVPPAVAPQALRAMTGAYFTPSIGDDAIKAAQQDAVVAAAEQRYDSQALLQDDLFAQLFSAGPNHFAPVPDAAAAFSAVPAADIRAFAARAFRAQNAVLSITGNVGAGLLAQIPTAPSGAAMDPPYDSTPSAQPAQSAQTAQQPGLGVAWVGPAIADTRAATALDFVADYLFDADHGTVSRAVNAAHPDLFMGGQFITLHDPGVLVVTVSGAQAVSVEQSILDAVSALENPLDATTFAAARAAFAYHILSQMQTPSERADTFGWYAAEGNAGYAPGDASNAYMNAVRSLDPAFVAQTVRRYLQHPAIAVLHARAQPETAT